MCRNSNFVLFLPMKTWKKHPSKTWFCKSCRNFQYCHKQPGFPRQLKTHIAFSSFPIVLRDTNLWFSGKATPLYKSEMNNRKRNWVRITVQSVILCKLWANRYLQCSLVGTGKFVRTTQEIIWRVLYDSCNNESWAGQIFWKKTLFSLGVLVTRLVI